MKTIERIQGAKFNFGQLVATPGAIAAITPLVITEALNRHGNGDWGDLDEEDKASNDAGLKGDGRLMSAYQAGGTKFWIITEWDRSVTTVLLPDEY